MVAPAWHFEGSEGGGVALQGHPVRLLYQCVVFRAAPRKPLGIGGTSDHGTTLQNKQV